MKRMIVVALAVVGVCMTATASASAHLFHSTLDSGTLLGLQTTVQIFIPFSGAGKVECRHATTLGSITALLGLHQLVTVHYSECEAFFQPVTISPAQYLLSADGLAAIENTIVIQAGGLANCTLTVKPQDLGTVKYQTVGTEIIEESSVKGIVSTGSGGSCGTNNTGGTYEGSNLVMEAGAGMSITWL
jgi:hypothetical protein